MADPLPQQATLGRPTAIERIVASFHLRNDIGTAVRAVQVDAFDDVIPRFHNLGCIESIQGSFIGSILDGSSN